MPDDLGVDLNRLYDDRAALRQGPGCDPEDLFPLEDRGELEKLALLGVCVAQKPFDVTWRKLNRFLLLGYQHCGTAAHALRGPFELLRLLRHKDLLGRLVRDVRFGQYTRIGRAFSCIGWLPDAWTYDDLVGVSGVNLKTAKLVELYRHPGQPVACLDRHVLRDMRSWQLVRTLGLRVPVESPQNPRVYAVLEEVFRQEALRRGLACWQLDKLCWQRFRVRRKPGKGVTA